MQVKYYEDKEVDGVVGWHWIESDSGAWDGPKQDWKSHLACITKYVKRYGHVIQAGGNCGMYPRLLAKHFDTVHTYEPDSLNFECLEQNISSTPHVTAELAAVGSARGWCKVERRSMSNVGMHQVVEDTIGTVVMTTIDDGDWEEVDLIMLDLEGFEFQALQGARKTIEKFKPVIFLERPGDDSTDFLRSLGYSEAEHSEMDVVFVPK